MVTHVCSLTRNGILKTIMKNKNAYNGESVSGDEKVYIDKQQMRAHMYLS